MIKIEQAEAVVVAVLNTLTDGCLPIPARWGSSHCHRPSSKDANGARQKSSNSHWSDETAADSLYFHSVVLKRLKFGVCV